MKYRIPFALLMVGILLAGSLFWIGTPTAAAQSNTEPGHSTVAPEQRPGPRGNRAFLAMPLVMATAEVSNLSITQVIERLEDGQSLADIAADNGSSGDEVVQVVREKAEEFLVLAVASGDITQEQADRMLERLTERATELVNDDTLGERVVQQVERTVRRLLIHSTADVTGLSFREIGQRLRDGESLSQIAESAGATSDEVIQQGETLLSERLGHVVAGGHLTQEQADELVAAFVELAQTMITETL